MSQDEGQTEGKQISSVVSFLKKNERPPRSNEEGGKANEKQPTTREKTQAEPRRGDEVTQEDKAKRTVFIGNVPFKGMRKWKLLKLLGVKESAVESVRFRSQPMEEAYVDRKKLGVILKKFTVSVYVCVGWIGSPEMHSAVQCSAVQCSGVMVCPVLSCPVLSCPVLPCPALSCPVLPCPALSCPVLFYPDAKDNQNAFITLKKEESLPDLLNKNGMVHEGYVLRINMMGEKTNFSRKKSVCIKNLDRKINESDLYKLLKDIDQIKSIRVLRDERTSISMGVSFVLFQNRSAVKKAIEMFHGHSVNGREIIVEKIEREDDARDGPKDVTRQGKQVKRTIWKSHREEQKVGHWNGRNLGRGNGRNIGRGNGRNTGHQTAHGAGRKKNTWGGGMHTAAKSDAKSDAKVMPK
ncbi:RNA binding protein putative [Plasmodium cynomolgi strain B]|uniref:RNA binding protein putative n=1 Tax=Plasmodium cynomolgi (strain B) TaxID=1120755 RepID=K6UCT5_PLACD|nr:RNA binding protein putative [Plasmodium cynomolgi strain B]GAB65411.1 RNA binding protein putative [Plasmodium cynomolgi strain B]